MQLNTRDQATISALLRRNVRLTMTDLRGALEESIWIGRRNRYATDTVNKIQTELSTGSIKKPRQLAQYVGASVVLHCSDGWSYLGRALAALLRGDPHRARHLAYYAELRAAMSLLASVGIGVFNNKHFVIDGRSSVAVIPKSYKTHVFVWDCLEIWGNLPSSGELFTRVIKPEGRDLDDWLQPLGGAAAVAAQARAWFMQWGMDLGVPHDDQFSRNESSYRPDGMHKTWAVDAAQVLSFARDFWLSMEPTTASRFDSIDRYILRAVCDSTFRGTSGQKPKPTLPGFKSHVAKIVAAQNLDESASDRWTKFLLRSNAPHDIQLMTYSQIPPSFSSETHFSIFSRAALLLRIASGSAMELLVEAGFSADEMGFWWGAVGNSRGIWDGIRGADTIIDLWADIAPVLGSLSEFQSNVPKNQQTFFRAANEIDPSISGLGSCERIAIWSLTPAI